MLNLNIRLIVIVILVRRGFYANIGRCPETSKDANG